LIGHAWVTMDGEHAIDLTWRGQTFRHAALPGRDYIMDPSTDYYGVEIPTEDVARITSSNSCYGLILEQWEAARAASQQS
jgi:hypothetical protein